jgi:hypothetical protein
MRGPGRIMALALLIAATLVLACGSATGAPAVAVAAGTTGTTTAVQTGAAAPVAGGGHNLPTMSLAQVRLLAGRSSAVKSWIHEHPVYRITPQYDPSAHQWTVYYVSKNRAAVDATQAEVLIDDRTSEITETRTGPQVAWMMARGYWGAFGRHINDPWLWTGLCLLFLIPLVDVRRVVSWRTLDLLALLGFSASLVWFNDGQIYTSVPLMYPPMAYLAVRMALIGTRRARRRAGGDPDPLPIARPTFSGWAPIWVLIAVLMLCVGLRYSLNAFDSNVIDVGYSGVIGAHKVVAGVAPYGHFPSDCGRCDTYGPATYLSYVPFEVAAPWTGHWDSLPAAHAAASVFDGICLVGMLTLGWMLGGVRLGLALATGWAAFPFTAYALESNTNDALVAAALIWGMVLFARPLGRGLMLGLAVMAKFTPAILLLAWWRHPFPRGQRRRDWLWYVAGVVIAAWATGWVILLDGFGGLTTFWSRTIAYQVNRTSPFSIWGQHPDLRPVQLALIGIVGIAAIAVARWPRERDFRTVAALSGALLIGLQLTMTYWFYLYIPWFLPFVLVATVPDWRGGRRGSPAPAPAARGVPASRVAET